MKFLVSLMILGASIAHADGFVCETLERDLNVKVYNNTQPQVGTRTAAVLVLADPAVGQGKQTIASFTDVKGTLSSKNLMYNAEVDLRVKESSRKGELISGTKLGELARVRLQVDFTYSRPVQSGDEMEGSLILVKRNHTVIARELTCKRYLKQ